jgi:HPt (histidine-containing phosphotransfer) domain-containing protein
MDAKASAAPAHQVPSAHSAIPAQPDAAFDLDEALQRVDGDLELLVEIAGIFLADAPGMLADVAAAVGRRDAPDVSRAAHRLKGSILTFSAPAAAAAALSLETAGRDGNLTTADTDLAALTTAMARLQTELGRLGRDQAQARKSA